MKICVVGGDKRFTYLADFFENDGYFVSRHITNDSDVYIFPILGDEIPENLNLIPNQSIVFAGYLTEKSRNEFQKYGINAKDYLDYEELALKNAIATAEGAIMLAMQNVETTLFNSKILVLGGGRIAKFIAGRLQGFGAKTLVGLRNKNDMVRLNSQNIETIPLKDLDFGEKFDIIINTIPANIITDENLKKIDENTYILDISSKPYGYNLDVASNLALHHEIAPKLPGRLFPKSSGRFIYETILENLKEE